MPRRAPDAFRFGCPICETRLEATPSQVGEKIRCPDCHESVIVPGAAAKDTNDEKTAKPRSDAAGSSPSAGKASPQAPIRVAAQPTPDPHQAQFDCPSCGTRFKSPASHAGRSQRCTDCHTLILIPEARLLTTHEAELLEDIAPLEIGEQSTRPEYRPLTRGVVDERALAEAKSRDLKAPEAARKRSSKDMLQFACTVCDSKLFAPRDRIGEVIVCGDCRTEQVVKPLEKKSTSTGQPDGIGSLENFAEFRLSDVAARPQPLDDQVRAIAQLALERAELESEERNMPPVAGSGRRPAADRPNRARTAQTPPRPAGPPRPAAPPPPPPASAPASEPASAATRSAAPRSRPQPSATAPPPPPPPSHSPPAPDWTAFGRTWQFLKQPDILRVWFTLAAGIAFIFVGMHMVSVFFTSTMMAFFGIMASIGIVLVGAPLLMYFNAVQLEIVKTTANGEDQVETPPADWVSEWFGNGATVVGAFLFGGLPASALAQVLPLGSPLTQFLLLVIVEMICFPIMLLSALESGTLFPPVSISVWKTLRSSREAWVRFWLESAALAVPLLIGFKISELAMWSAAISAVIWSATFLVYFRRLGVLGLACAHTIND